MNLDEFKCCKCDMWFGRYFLHSYYTQLICANCLSVVSKKRTEFELKQQAREFRDAPASKMSTRYLLAGMAMEAYIHVYGGQGKRLADKIVPAAVEMTDALIAELDKE